MAFGEQLQALRREHQLTQEEFAAQLKVSRQAVSKWESSRGYPEIEKIIYICNRYGTTMDELFADEVPVERNPVEANDQPQALRERPLKTVLADFASNLSFTHKCLIGGLLVAAALLFWPKASNSADKPVLTVETPQKISLSQTEEFTLDVTVSNLGDARYPAMSMSISFDSARLEFLGVEEGNVFILSDENSTGQQLPDWSCNVGTSNDTGLINIMYLDMTGGRNAFTKELLADDYNVVLRLKFRLRGSVRPGDVLDLIVEDAVFAASDETQSLAMTRDTLKVKNGRLVIGE